MLIKEALFSQTSLPVVQKSLDACAFRSKAIANNLANVSTPGYKRIEVEFESKLKDALSDWKVKGLKTQNSHLDLGRPKVEKVEYMGYRPKDDSKPGEVNNVDIDIEMAKLAENQILFNYGVRFVQERRGAIDAAIKLQSQK